MAGCKHTRWLRLARKDEGLALEVSDRAQRLLDCLPSPEKQTPSINVLVGNQSKQRLLHKLAINTTGPRGKRGHGEIHMFIAPSSVRSESPVLIADGDIPPQNRLGRPWKPQLCHEVNVRPFMSPIQGKMADIADHIYHRLLLPFADVICLFATDLGGIEKTVRRLALWMDKGPLSTTEARPWLIIVIDDGPEAEAVATFQDLMRIETSIDPMDHFGGIRLFSLVESRNRGGYHGSPWDRLSRELSKVSQLARQKRVDVGHLYAARHLAGFLEHAASCAAEIPREPFNFIRTSRLNNPVAVDLEAHLARFLRNFHSLDALKSFALPMVASSFILDHYPPGMHPFHSNDVFVTLYKQVCTSVCKSAVLAQDRSNAFILPSAFSRLVEQELLEQYSQYLFHGSAKALHELVIARFQQQWVGLCSDDTCFCCIRRRPQFGLPCGHSLCETCVKVFGRESTADPWVLDIDTCVLCKMEMPDIHIKVKPDTASVRALSIDGGGTRGRVPLEFIRVLQDRLRLPYPIQRNFDVVYGTSSGAIIAFALFVNGWPVEDCIASFENLARLAFKPRPSHWIPFLSKIYEFAVSLLVDSRYPAKNLETALRMVFGSTRTIIDCSKASEMGTMVGMPVTTIRDVSPCIFTNYNGVGRREGTSDYYVLHPEGATRRVPLWEVLRCATAAPYYFKPRHIDGLGTFQDGGLMYNNPTSIALQEVAALYPATPEPSLVVSLGTGSARAERPDTSSSRHLWKDSFLLRVFRAFWQYGSSKRAWQQLLSHQKVGKTGEFFRFDVEFDGPEPSLDDVFVMEEIGEIARETILDSPALDRLVLHIRAELFVFELDPRCPFQLVNGLYKGVGRIFCRLRAKTPEFDALMAQLDQASAAFFIGESVLPGSFQDRSAKLEDGNFSKEVRFRTPSRLDPIMISLRESDTPYPISGAPFTLQGLMESQSLESRFGTADHRKRKWPTGEREEPQKKRARRR